MKMVKLIKEKVYALANKGECTEMYSIEDLETYPGISKGEYSECKALFYDSNNVVGFMKQNDYSASCIEFIQVYKDQIEVVEEIIKETPKLVCQHDYRFLRTNSYGKDIFYCTKCLEYKTIK